MFSEPSALSHANLLTTTQKEVHCMQKRILYITYVDYLKNDFPGVQTKIGDHIMTLQQNGYHVDRVNQYGKAAQLIDCTTGKTVQYESPFFARASIKKAVMAALSQNDYIGAYIRFQFFSNDVLQICKAIKKRNLKLLMEIPTYPYEPELQVQGMKGKVKLLCDRIFRYPCAKYLDSFVVMTDDKIIYNVPCIYMANGLDYSAHPLRTIRAPKENEIHIAAVAAMMPPHGYDRLLNGLADYYKSENNKVNFVIHLIGEGCEIPKYKEITETNGLDEHVIFHGMQTGNALESIVSECDIAAGLLGAFRTGRKTTSPLKARNYCAWGFPSINANPVDILSMDDPYALFIPEDESPVDMERVAQFYHNVYFERGLTAEEIAKEIRSAAEAISDVRVVFMPVVEFFNS